MGHLVAQSVTVTTSNTTTTAILDQRQKHVFVLHPQHHQEHHIHHLVYQESSPGQSDTENYPPSTQMFSLFRHLLPSVWHLPDRDGPDGTVRKQGKNDSIWRTLRGVCLRLCSV